MIEILQGMLLAFTLKASGAGLSFAFNIIAARLLGAEGSGQYFLALSITAIGSLIGRVGLDNTLLRFIAIKSTNKDWAGVRGIYSLGMRIAISASLIVTLSILILAPWLADKLFKNQQLIEPLRWMSLSILPFSVLNLQSECLKGIKHIREAMLVQSVGVPLISVILLIPLVSRSGIIGACIAYLSGTIIVCVTGKWVWNNAMMNREATTKKILFSKIWGTCRPLFLVSLLNEGVRPWAPLFLLGILSTATEVGIFGAAMRIVSLTTFMLFTINNVLAPKLAELYTKNDMIMFATTARRSAGMIALLASPIFLLFILRSEWVMYVFGKEFTQGGFVLAVLAAGQIANVFTGSLGVILIITGNEKLTQNLTIASTIALVIISFLLIPSMGGIGAALAISISGTGLSVASAFYVQRRLGIKAIPLFNRL